MQNYIDNGVRYYKKPECLLIPFKLRTILNDIKKTFELNNKIKIHIIFTNCDNSSTYFTF